MGVVLRPLRPDHDSVFRSASYNYGMADPRKSVHENVPGDFFVDTTCIDCDTCRQLAPAVFAEGPGTAYVHRLPGDAADRRQALRALLACPTGSIGDQAEVGRE